MATRKEYLEFVLEQLSMLDGVTHRFMMGEYILYYRGKIFGGIYDDRLLVKATPSAVRMMPDAEFQEPYEGAKPMLTVTEIDSRVFLKELVEAMYMELPEPRKKKN